MSSMRPPPNNSPAAGVLPLYDLHAAQVLAFLRTRVTRGVDAEDLAQELWRRLHNILGADGVIPGNPRAYLFRAARNLLEDEARSRRPQLLPDGYDVAQDARSPLDTLGDIEYSRRVEDCVRRLPANQAEMLRRRSEGEKSADIAVSLGSTPDQVYKQLFNARRSLEDCLGLSREEP